VKDSLKWQLASITSKKIANIVNSRKKARIVVGFKLKATNRDQNPKEMTSKKFIWRKQAKQIATLEANVLKSKNWLA
jgi:RNase H-fold protein (predicted Holliday junction resolvase)